MARPKELIFQADMKKFSVLAAIALAVAALMVRTGLWGLRVFPPEVRDPLMRTLAGYLPMVMAGIIVGGLVISYLQAARRVLVITPRALLYKKGRKQMVIPWEKAFFGPPAHWKKRFRTAVVSDGLHFIRFEEFFFPRFEEMCRLIERSCEEAKGSDLTL